MLVTVYILIYCVSFPPPHHFLSTPFPSCSTMLRSWADFPSCWKWAPVQWALSLWQGTTMLWANTEPQQRRSVQLLVWARGRCVEEAPQDITSFNHCQPTTRAGRSIVQDWLEGPVHFLTRTLSWSPRVSQPAMTPSISHTCLATPLLCIQTVLGCLSMWPRLLMLEGGCLVWMEIWQ